MIHEKEKTELLTKDQVNEDIYKNNLVVLTGRLNSPFIREGEADGERIYRTYMQVRRDSGVTDNVMVYISERFLPGGIHSLRYPYRIRGHLRSGIRHGHESGSRYEPYVLAREVSVLNEAENDFSENKVFLNAFVCRPGSYRITPHGRKICNIQVSVGGYYGRNEYIPCILWGRNAVLAEKLCRGDHILIWGRMQSREFKKVLESGERSLVRLNELSINSLRQIK